MKSSVLTTRSPFAVTVILIASTLLGTLLLASCQEREHAAREALEDDLGDGPADVTVEGAIQKIDPPRSVENGALESDATIYLFEERDDEALSGKELQLDITEPGRYAHASPLTNARLSPAQVTSYFLTLDPNGDKARNLTREGTVVFPEPILGLCVRAACLETLNETLGAPSTRYQPKNSHHGTDIGEDSDYLVVEDDRRTLRVSLGAGQYIDQLRVVTGRP